MKQTFEHSLSRDEVWDIFDFYVNQLKFLEMAWKQNPNDNQIQVQAISAKNYLIAAIQDLYEE